MTDTAAIADELTPVFLELGKALYMRQAFEGTLVMIFSLISHEEADAAIPKTEVKRTATAVCGALREAVGITKIRTRIGDRISGAAPFSHYMRHNGIYQQQFRHRRTVPALEFPPKIIKFREKCYFAADLIATLPSKLARYTKRKFHASDYEVRRQRIACSFANPNANLDKSAESKCRFALAVCRHNCNAVTSCIEIVVLSDGGRHSYPLF